MNKTIGWIIAIVVIVGGGWYFMSDKDSAPVTPVKDTGPIKIGLIAPLTGDTASVGSPIANSVTMAVDEINAKGGINGQQIVLIKEDGKCNPKDATTAAQKLINVDGVKIIIGGTCSGEMLAIAPLAEAAKVIAISPSASNPAITQSGDYIFRNNPSDSSGGADLAELVIKKYKKVAIISESTDYAQGVRGVFLQKFKELGGEVVFDESYPTETKDFRGLITKIKTLNPDAIFVNSQSGTNGGLIIKQARESGLNQQLFSAVAVSDSEVLKVGGKYTEGLIGVALPSLSQDNEKAVDFLKRYKQKYTNSNIEFYMGAAYDDVYILAEAINSVGLDTSKIKDYLYSIKSYDGIIGKYGFDSNGDIVGIKNAERIIKNGESVEVK